MQTKLLERTTEMRHLGSRYVIASGVALLALLAAPLHAGNNGGGVLGICAGWMASDGLLSSDCEVMGDNSGLGIALTTNSSPSFHIWVNDNPDIVQDVRLIVLIPQGLTPNFTVTFTQGTDTTVPLNTMSVGVLSGTLSEPPPQLHLLSDVFGLDTFNTGTDYTFGNIAGVAIPGITAYDAFLFPTSFDLNSDPSSAIFVKFEGEALPNGTIILAVGFNYDNELVFLMPLTTGLQVVPEPGSLLLMGSGLAGLAAFLRRKRNKRT